MRDGCPFCDYEGPNQLLMNDGMAYAIEPLRQVAPGHVLVIPQLHIEDAGDIPTARKREAAMAAWELAGDIIGGRAVFFDGRHIEPFEANLITSRGALATQTVKHFHIHVLPRRENDGLLLPWSEGSAGARPTRSVPLRSEVCEVHGGACGKPPIAKVGLPSPHAQWACEDAFREFTGRPE